MKLTLNFFAGFAAGTFVMPSPVSRPATASAIRMMPAQDRCSASFSNSQPPATVPPMMAMKVPNSSTPLPQESWRSGISSVSRPYLDGPKMALCTPIRNTHPSVSQRLAAANPASAPAMTRISKHFTPRTTVRLLNRSARYPPVMENRMNGTANSPPMTATSRSRRSLGRLMEVTMEMASHLSVLSLNAPWNCVTMSAQKPRVDSAGLAALASVMVVSFMGTSVAQSRQSR